jgi:hypothetical protein
MNSFAGLGKPFWTLFGHVYTIFKPHTKFSNNGNSRFYTKTHTGLGQFPAAAAVVAREIKSLLFMDIEMN